MAIGLGGALLEGLALGAALLGDSPMVESLLLSALLNPFDRDWDPRHA